MKHQLPAPQTIAAWNIGGSFEQKGPLLTGLATQVSFARFVVVTV